MTEHLQDPNRSGFHDPECTVVMAAFNAGATIAQSIASVLAQTRPDFELIVVDDGSTDDTAAVVREYAADPRVRIHRQSNAGPTKARNVGIALARGRYVSILDSDDLWFPRYLELMVGALERVPDAGFAHTRAWILERARNRVCRAPWPASLPSIPSDDSEALLRALIDRNFVCGLVTVRREVLQGVGGYDLGWAEDYDLWLRIAAAGHGAVRVSGPLVVCSDRSDSRSKDDLAMCDGKLQAYERLLSRNSLSPEIRTLVEHRLAETARVHALFAAKRRPGPTEYLRRVGGTATRPLRQRSRLRGAPPPEVAAWFPGLGRGSRDGSGAKWVRLSGESRAATRNVDRVAR